MKKQWISKGLTGLFACTLVFGTASYAFAKGPDKGHATQTHQATHQDVKKTETSVTKTAKKASHKQDSTKGKKEVKINSQVGKNIEKLLNSSEATINKITALVNSYFKVDANGTAQISVSTNTASYAYNGFTGKLNAELNKLHAIDKMIAVDQKKNKSASTDLTALAAKSKELQQNASDEIKEVATLAKQASTPKSTDGSTTPTDTTGTTTGTTDPSTTGTTTDTTGTTSTSPTDTTTTGTSTGPAGTPTTGSTTDTTTNQP
ncbi:MAG: hypothetical protein Q8934_11280 [Bacillota bacterium]|nr:hypothetical protein [Bacillota bacterium]